MPLYPDHVEGCPADASHLSSLHAGEECVLAGNRRVVRKTEARIVCSPDSKVHMLVREPQFCHYVFVIYSPAMCSLDKFKPLDRAVKKNKVVDDDDDDDDDEYV